MIYITGDTHGNFRRFLPRYFPAGRELRREDYIIICGDFGGVWDNTTASVRLLDELADKPFTILFVDGNHENFDMLNKMPVLHWHGGVAHEVRKNILHLMRGQIFDIGGLTFFTMGGASSHDITDGILEPDAPNFRQERRRLKRQGAQFRINHESWWQEELPCDAEYEMALHNLKKADWKVDCILTHCAPTSIAGMLDRHYRPDRLTDFLEIVREKCLFDYWFFGHYHSDSTINERFLLLWERMVALTTDEADR